MHVPQRWWGKLVKRNRRVIKYSIKKYELYFTRGIVWAGYDANSQAFFFFASHLIATHHHFAWFSSKISCNPNDRRPSIWKHVRRTWPMNSITRLLVHSTPIFYSGWFARVAEKYSWRYMQYIHFIIGLLVIKNEKKEKIKLKKKKDARLWRRWSHTSSCGAHVWSPPFTLFSNRPLYKLSLVGSLGPLPRSLSPLLFFCVQAHNKHVMYTAHRHTAVLFTAINSFF